MEQEIAVSFDAIKEMNVGQVQELTKQQEDFILMREDE